MIRKSVREMLKLSRISRSIITTIYIVTLCVISFIILKQNEVTSIKAYQIFLYIIIEILCICLYYIIKKRLRDKITNQKVRRIYRFSYFAVLVIISRIIMIYVTRTNIDYSISYQGMASYILKGLISITGEEKYAAVIINTLIAFINCVFIKKLMLDIFDNDAIATMSGAMYVLSPVTLITCLKFEPIMFNTLFILMGIYLMFKIHEEITLYASSSKRYIKASVLLGICIFLDVLFGGSILCWVALIAIIGFVTDYIDKQKLVINKKKSLRNPRGKKGKYFVSKLIIVWIIALICGLIGITIFKATNMASNVLQNCNESFGTFYVIYEIFVVIAIVVEALSLYLKRISDSKISLVKTMSIIFIIYSTVYVKSIILYDAIFSIAFVASICGMYYNRDEKTKLLSGGNK